MTCRQLGGACDEEFQAETFEEMGNLSKQHAMEKAQAGDQAHIEKMDEMMELMKNPEAMNAWFASKQKEFESLQEE